MTWLIDLILRFVYGESLGNFYIEYCNRQKEDDDTEGYW